MRLDHLLSKEHSNTTRYTVCVVCLVVSEICGAAVTGVDRCHAHGWNINETTHRLVCGSWRIVGSWSNRPPRVWCGCFSSVPDLIQHVTVFGGVVGGCGVVVWLLHSGREHLVRMTPLLWGVVFMYVIFSTRHNRSGCVGCVLLLMNQWFALVCVSC